MSDGRSARRILRELDAPIYIEIDGAMFRLGKLVKVFAAECVVPESIGGERRCREPNKADVIRLIARRRREVLTSRRGGAAWHVA